MAMSTNARELHGKRIEKAVSHRGGSHTKTIEHCTQAHTSTHTQIHTRTGKTTDIKGLKYSRPWVPSPAPTNK